MNNQNFSKVLNKLSNQDQIFSRLYTGEVSRGETEIITNQSNVWARTIAWTMMGGTCVAIGWLATAKTEEVIATGKLEPISGVVDVQMPLQGIAKEIHVEDGDRVKKGEILIVLDTEQSKERKKQ